jgi:hypothetical protein
VDTRAGYLGFNFKEAGRATISFADFTPPFVAVALIGSPPEADGTLIWRVHTSGDRSIAVRMNSSTDYVELIYEDLASGATERLGNPFFIHATGDPTEVAVLVRTPTYGLFVNGQAMLEVVEDRVGGTSSPLSMSVSGTTGVIALLELRVNEAP